MKRENTEGGIARYWPRFLLVIPYLLVAFVPAYNRIEPALSGIPFFYWYQLAAILVGACIVFLVYRLEVRVTHTLARKRAELDSSGTPGDIL